MIDVIRSLVRRYMPLQMRIMLNKKAYQLKFRKRPPLRYPFWEFMWHKKTDRPQYLWGTLCAALVARKLGYSRISVIEFGVAGGNGLVCLEDCARVVAKASGVAIDVIGFDSGKGLPRPQDYRDLPQMWREGSFGIDLERLKARLTNAQILLGPVKTTVPDFIRSKPAPVGFISFDLDLYHSTMDAFALFEAETEFILPRVVCYFDDIMAYSHSDYSGERLAISDFNSTHKHRKLSPIYGLRHLLGIDKWWIEMMYMFHAFDHNRYNDYDGTHPMTELPLTGD